MYFIVLILFVFTSSSMASTESVESLESTEINSVTLLDDEYDYTQELRTHWWNPAADHVIVLDPNGEGAVDFIWRSAERFPHPLIKAVDPAVYRAFARVFIQFFTTPGALEFLLAHDLLNIELVSRFLDGDVAYQGSFFQIAAQFADVNQVSDLPEDLRVKMASIRDTIAAHGGY